MSSDAELPSLDAMAAHGERLEQGMLALRRELAGRVVTARDEYELVEVGVDASGEVVSVALNDALVGRVDTKTLANATLQAAQAAQRDARELVRQRKAYHLGTT